MTDTVRIAELESWEISPQVAKRVLCGVLRLREAITEDDELRPHEAVAIVVYTWLWREMPGAADLLGPAVQRLVEDLREKIDETWRGALEGSGEDRIADLRAAVLDETWLTWSGCRGRGFDLKTGEMVTMPKPVITTKTLYVTGAILGMVLTVKQHRKQVATCGG